MVKYLLWEINNYDLSVRICCNLSKYLAEEKVNMVQVLTTDTRFLSLLQNLRTLT